MQIFSKPVDIFFLPQIPQIKAQINPQIVFVDNIPGPFSCNSSDKLEHKICDFICALICENLREIFKHYLYPADLRKSVEMTLDL